MATQNKTTNKPKKPTENSKFRRWFTHGSGGHLVVIGFVILLTVAFLIYAASQGILKQYTYLIVLLAVTVIVQLVLWLRIRKQTK